MAYTIARATLLLIATASMSLSCAADDLGKGIPSSDALRTKMALKLAGLVTFVASSCPELRADYTRFKTAIGSLGVTPDDLSQTEKKSEYLGYALRYQQDTKTNCTRARTDFGPEGKTVPNIFQVGTR